MLCIAQVLIIEVAERTAYLDLVALFPCVEDVLRGIGGVRELDGKSVAGVFAAERILGI